MKKYLLLFLLSSLVFQAKTQDVHFSQIHASPIFLNPAMTGLFNQDLRFIANYKNQWINTGANFNTICLSADGRIASLGKMANLNIGFIAFSDAAGDLSYRQTNIQVPISVNLNFGKQRSSNKHLLSLGIQNGLFHQNADLSKIVAFDSEPLIGSLFTTNKFQYDLSYGLVWNTIIQNKHSFYLGFSQSHLNSPQVNTSDLNQADYLHSKLLVHGGADISFANEKQAILPSWIITSQGPHREFLSGLYYRINLSSKVKNQVSNAIYFGAWARWYAIKSYNSGFDALITSLRYDHKNVSISASYDFTLSKLTLANRAQGGAELSLIYALEINKKKKTNKVVYCPKF
ncbi:MAG: PorP/SprF family type IX secretion system membrane protein [Chitinophagales bacterium]|nr:PorP/SprF family type IX secretion system membrane protein [Chitinophagales bacterium]